MQYNIEKKREHTFRVVDIITQVAQSLSVSANDIIMAKIIALFHDVARFLQLQKYSTFFDAKSFNHGVMAVQILKEHQVLKLIETPIQLIIFNAIANHNLASLPSDEPQESQFFSKLIRDADKLDIFYLILDYYRPGFQRENAIDFNYPDIPEVSTVIYNAILEHKIIRFNELKTMNDLKFMQMGWVFDINFPRSFQIIRDNQYIKQIYDTIKPTPQVKFLFQYIENYLNAHCS